MSESKQSLGQKALQGFKEYFAIALYLFIVFALFTTYKAVVLAEHHIDFAPHGFALINALALAKVILVAQKFRLGDQFPDAPLIYPTLLKSFAFAILLACFKLAEQAVVNLFHGRSLLETVSSVGDGPWKSVLSITLLLFVVLIPFFGFIELQRVFGRDRLVGAFFRPQRLLNTEPARS